MITELPGQSAVCLCMLDTCSVLRQLTQGFLQVRGTGYRKGRKGHPLPNIYRQVRSTCSCNQVAVSVSHHLDSLRSTTPA